MLMALCTSAMVTVLSLLQSPSLADDVMLRMMSLASIFPAVAFKLLSFFAW
jgi:hypothetical protein